MSQITLRGIDPDVERKIRKMAKLSGKSINRVVLDIINESAGLGGKKLPANSLKKLAGGWSENEALNFFESIKSSEQIDEEMWK
jgi:hypothetical protein